MGPPAVVRDPPATHHPPLAVVLAAVAGGYGLGSLTAFVLFQASDVGAVLFPSAGVTLAALVLSPRRRWPWLLATVALVETAMDLAFGLRPLSVPGFVLANVAEPLVGAALLLRLAPSPDLSRRRDLAAFVGCAVVAGPFVGALVGASTNAVVLGRNWLDAFLPFWAGDGLGVLTVGGALLTWRAGWHRSAARTLVERAGVVAVTCLVTVLAFWPDTVPLAYLPILLLVWFAFVHGVPAVALAGVGMALTANVVTAAGWGPWAALAGTPNLEIATLQLFLAVAILSAWLLAVEIAAQRRARSRSQQEIAARRRVEALQEVTAGLARAATSEAIALVVMRRGLRLIADEGAVGVHSADGSRLRLWVTQADGQVQAVGELSVSSRSLITAALRAGAPVRAQTRAEMDALYPDSLAVRRDAGIHSALAVPARIGDVTVGALAFGFTAERAADADVAALAATLAELMAQALLRARLYEEEREAAHQLQRALLPSVPEELPGMRVAGCYRPADKDNDVGGDWYDAFALPGGRTGFVVGDIVGHDLRAAAAMGRLHAVLQVFAAREGSSPQLVLHGLDDACLRIPGAQFATVGYGDYDPATCQLRYACAGHLPPLLVVDHRAEFLMGGRSTPLAVQAGVRREASLEVPPGAMLLWYSDGLVERRDSDLDAGMERLAAVSRSLTGDEPRVWCDAVIEELVGGHALHDDVVLICLRLGGPPAVGASPLEEEPEELVAGGPVSTAQPLGLVPPTRSAPEVVSVWAGAGSNRRPLAFQASARTD